MKKKQERLKELFEKLEQLAVSPLSDTTNIKLELADLRQRLLDLEKQLHEETELQHNSDNKPEALPEPVGHDTSRIDIYEKEQVGFSFSGDRLESINDQEHVDSDENILLSHLAAGNQIIGELQVTPRPDRHLNDDQILLTNAVAQQVSLQIQNLRLLSAAERSRAEAESASRRFVHEGWDAYLDAIQRKESVGYIYDQASVSPHDDHVHLNGGVQIPIQVTGEQVGVVYIEPGSNHQLVQDDTTLIGAVADQVAQQVENLRLLADASRARAEADEILRRVTRENWQDFTSQYEDAQLAYVYDKLQVVPLDESQQQAPLDLAMPLTVQGEVVGELGLTRTRAIQHEDIHLAEALASQVSIHLETLRLNAELQKRARELQELDRLKSAFLANMSHELRTPLNSILGFTDVMLEGLDGPLTEFMNHDLRLVQKNGQHLLHLINDVLDMAKIESGRMNLHPEKFILHDLLDEITSITSGLASEKNNALFIEEDSDREVEIYADNTRIRQVMINVVNNAIKFTTNGKIALRTTKLEDARVLITIKDTGLGIPPDHLEAIFQEFTQVDTSTTRKVGGTGLGLPISRRLVEMHGGHLWAESTGVEGEGSTFFVELPIEARIVEIIEKQEK